MIKKKFPSIPINTTFIACLVSFPKTCSESHTSVILSKQSIKQRVYAIAGSKNIVAGIIFAGKHNRTNRPDLKNTDYVSDNPTF
ncbi:MAG: hypothetical protein ACK4VN_08865 [Bacteroidales bacterium]